ncbi:MAG: OmpA family protein [Muribaculaceae bacterium]|nr:OmpA family protein [Muribaculaceae bacterium]
MKTIQKILVAAIATVLLCPAGLEAKKNKVDIYELSLEQNIDEPQIRDEKHSQRVQKYQYKVAVELKKQGYEVELMRDDEVIVVTLQAGTLFEPNGTELTELGKKSLSPLNKYLSNPGFYKMLLVMHSDNTGSSSYTLDLTRSRVNSVFDWMERVTSVDFVVPYALGATDPVEDNNSMESRKHNRRLEVYLVPGEVMVNQAKKGEVNINLMTGK